MHETVLYAREMIDPIESIDPDEARRNLATSRAAYLAAETAAEKAVAASDEAGEPRVNGVLNRELHLAERDAIAALLDMKDDYEQALKTWHAVLSLSN